MAHNIGRLGRESGAPSTWGRGACVRSSWAQTPKEVSARDTVEKKPKEEAEMLLAAWKKALEKSE